MRLNDYLTSKKSELKKINDQTYIDDLRKVLSTKEGLEIFRRLLDSASVFTSCFTGNSTTFYNEGRRDVGLNILGDILNADPEFLSKIFKIHAEKSQFEKQLEQKWIEEFNNDN